MTAPIFSPADILLPDLSRIDAEQWSVIACDQFTGDPLYWQELEDYIGTAPSALRLTLPEIYLEQPDVEERISAIHAAMEDYLQSGIFRCYENALIYVERIQSNGVLRTGVVGKIDLEAYDYTPGSTSPVRATEATVLERIPPRVRVRQEAALELPHIMILIDDPRDLAIGTCTKAKAQMQELYRTELSRGGGSIAGYLMDPAQQSAFLAQLSAVEQASGDLQYAMGDGNHSLATAKACWEAIKAADPTAAVREHPARYALVELVNLHSEALQFEAIHRIVTGTDPQALLAALTERLALSEIPSLQPVTILRQGSRELRYIHAATSNLAVGSLQNALDALLPATGGKIDYIHGEETVERLSSAPDAIGFLLPDMDKSELFPSVRKDGALPRKTFSMGHAEDKRYYMEGRRIRD